MDVNYIVLAKHEDGTIEAVSTPQPKLAGATAVMLTARRRAKERANGRRYAVAFFEVPFDDEFA